VSDIELAWAAGFFDGEGYTGLSKISRKILKPSGKRYDRKSYKFYPTVNIAQVHREPLDRFNIAVGYGKVYGPYGPYKTGKQPYYTYQASGYENVKTIIDLLFPYLCDVKRDQATDVLHKYLEQDKDIGNLAA